MPSEKNGTNGRASEEVNPLDARLSNGSESLNVTENIEIVHAAESIEGATDGGAAGSIENAANSAPKANERGRNKTVIALVLVAFVAFVIGQAAAAGGIVSIFARSPEKLEAGASTTATEIATRLAEVATLLDANGLYDFDADSATEGTITELLQASGDEYAQYMDEDYYSWYLDMTSGSYMGIGITITQLGSYTVVSSVTEDSPADEAGVQYGDVIVSIDGDEGPWTPTTAAEAIEREEGEFVEIVWLRPSSESLDALVTYAMSSTSSENASDDESSDESEESAESVEGEATSSASSTSSTSSENTESEQSTDSDTSSAEPALEGETIETSIEYSEIVTPSVEYEMIDTVGYIELSSFSMTSGEEIRTALEELMDSGATGIVLDLRDNGGGYLDQAIEVLSAFIDEGTAVQLHSLSGEEDLEVSGDSICDLPLTVLVNAQSASASEIVAAALQDYGRATVVGTTTYGKGTVQSMIALSFGGAVKFTIAEYRSPDGDVIDGEGVSPDVEVEASSSSDGQDAQLNAALEILAS